MRDSPEPARLACRPCVQTRARHGAAARPVRRRKSHSFPQPRCARRSACMSVEVTRLPSGLVVVTDAMPHLHTASLGCWVACGSRNEHSDEHGISHFLEHMAFKGTARRTARQIADEIEAVGGDLNARTRAETTAYSSRVLQAAICLGLDAPSGILTHPSFHPAQITRATRA